MRKQVGLALVAIEKVVVVQNKHDEMFAEMRLNVLERELKFLWHQHQAAILNWHIPYSTDIDDWDRDDRAKMQMRVLVRVDVNDDEHDAVIDFAQLVPKVTVKLW